MKEIPIGDLMGQRLSVLLALRSIGTAATLWVLVGVPVAGSVAAFCLSVWVIRSFPEMAVTATILGAVQGLWFYLAGQRSKPEHDDIFQLGLFSGVFLGVLGFPPVFSRADIIASPSTVAVCLLAAIVGGVASGVISARVLAKPLQGSRLRLGWGVVIGGLVLLAALDYDFYWHATIERISVPEVSHQEIASLSTGNAMGSAWSGCYEYLGRLPLGTGGEHGQIKVTQTDGVLKVEVGGLGEPHLLQGGVDRNGSFHFGGEMNTDQGVFRVLWQGRFYDNSLEFSRRMSTPNEAGKYHLGALLLTGTAQLSPCDH